jgi:Bacterial Ig-like domain (group 3)
MTRPWLRELKMMSQARRQSARRRNGRRLCWLEGLEERVVLSPTVYTVNSAASSNAGTGDSGTLPYVISQANSNPNAAGSEIEFDPSVFSAGSPVTITLASTVELSETAGPEVIDGPGASGVTVNGTDRVGVFLVDSGVTATLNGLTIANGSAPLEESATQLYGNICNNGTLTVDDCTITGGFAQSAGGGIFNNVGTLNVVGCTITGNVSNILGGGIYSRGGDMQISGGCTISNNSATDGGDGIWSDGQVKITGSMLADNDDTFGDGGAFFEDGGTATISGCSILNNKVGGDEGFSLGAGIYVRSGTLVLTGSTLAGNSVDNDGDKGSASGGVGGGLFNSNAQVQITNCKFANNVAEGLGGGAICNVGGTMVLGDSTIENNTASSSGGGLYVVGGNVTITGTSIENNAANTSGGGIDFDNGSAQALEEGVEASDLTIANSTIASNTASDGGGIWSGSPVENETQLVIVNATIAYNSASGGPGSGGGLDATTGSADALDNTIIALNTDGTSSSVQADDIDGSVSGSYNLVGTGGSGLTTADGNQGGIADAFLGTLGTYGGSTETIPLLPGSPAIGAGSDNIPGVTVPTSDQRGVARPSDSIDVGAFQDQRFTITLESGAGSQSALVNTAFANPLSVEVASPAGDPVAGGIVRFTAPSSGASASLSAETAAVGSDGHAGVTATANGTVGAYDVTVSTAGAAAPGLFTLTNHAPAMSLVPTTTGLSASSNPSTFGQKVTFTAVVSSPETSQADPTGPVIFTIDGQAEPPVELAVVNGVDKASFSTATLTAGPHAISAAYSGDTIFAASTVATSLAHSVNAPAPIATSTHLTASADPSLAGQSVIYTATVTLTAGTGTPTGDVIFTIDGHSGAPVPLAEINGTEQATFTTSSPTAGAHTIVASYAGNASFAPSQASEMTQQVNPVPPPVLPKSVDGPKIVSVLRYGYHRMATTLVLTFDQALDAVTADNAKDFRVIGPAGGVIGDVTSERADQHPSHL